MPSEQCASECTLPAKDRANNAVVLSLFILNNLEGHWDFGEAPTVGTKEFLAVLMARTRSWSTEMSRGTLPYWVKSNLSSCLPSSLTRSRPGYDQSECLISA